MDSDGTGVDARDRCVGNYIVDASVRGGVAPVFEDRAELLDYGEDGV